MITVKFCRRIVVLVSILLGLSITIKALGNGQGVSYNYSEKVDAYRKAANQGDAVAQYNLGLCYYKGYGVSQSYSEAVKWYQKAAKQGNVDAQNNLGLCYTHGYGVPQSYSEAVVWFRKAANQGDAVAQNNLGLCYTHGHGVPQSFSEALAWYQKAANQGDADAQYNLGVCYTNGEGVPQSYTEAVKWYQKAANQGYADAQYNLGVFYEDGNGVPQSYSEAVTWYRKAANQGDARAQYKLGHCYFEGNGVPQSYLEAVGWFRKAATQGHSTAQCNLGLIYEYGFGVHQSNSEAYYWFRQAAEQGHPYAIGVLKSLESDAVQVPPPAHQVKTIETFTVKGVSFDMALVEGGTFKMGSNIRDNEKPVHNETVATFYIGKTEVTQQLWTAVMGNNPSVFKGANLPVDNVSWEDCQKFVDRLSRLTGKAFRLPTEAEWEYAARGGRQSRGYIYSGSNDIDQVAWYSDNGMVKTHPVAQKLANELGIFDMTGNVHEWCSDKYSENYNSPRNSSYPIIRGGQWDTPASLSYIGFRNYSFPDAKDGAYGLRLAL